MFLSYWLILLTSMKWKSLSDLLYMKEEKWHNHFGKQLQCHTELNRCLTFTQQRKKEIFFVPNSCMNDHSFICNNSKLGKKKKSINKWINKHHWAIYGKKKKQQVGFLFLKVQTWLNTLELEEGCVLHNCVALDCNEYMSQKN